MLNSFKEWCLGNIFIHVSIYTYICAYKKVKIKSARSNSSQTLKYCVSGKSHL
jgi:hypothetical protein